MVAGVTLEQTVLGHALNDPDCFYIFSQEVRSEDFSVPNHKVMAHCLLAMASRGINYPDEDTFQLVVDSYPGDDKDYGGAEYIRTLKQGFTEPTGNYEAFIVTLKLQAAKSKIASNYLEKILKVVNNPLTTASQVKSVLDEAIASLESVETTSIGFSHASDMVQIYRHELENRTSRPFYTTGLPALDEHLSEGFSPTKLSVLAGFTGMAKSTSAIAMAHRIAVQGIGVGFFSMETQKQGVWDKLISSLTQIPIVRLKKETINLTDDERARIDDALVDLSKLPILVNDRASMSIAEMRHEILAASRKGNDIRVVFIDLFGKLEDVDTGENLAAKIQMMCKQMRVLAQELDVHFVLIVQVGRQGFGRLRSGGIRRPTLVDIKNANAYAEEADLVLFVHRNKYYLPELEDDILEFHVAKQRDGEQGMACYFEMFADRATIMSTNKRPHDVGGSEQHSN